MGCWAGCETENADKQMPASLSAGWKYERDGEKLIEGDSILQQSGLSDMLFLIFSSKPKKKTTKKQPVCK